MCSHDDGRGPLSFDQFAAFLQEPPYEPCESELDFLTPEEYEDSFAEVMHRYRSRITHYIARITEDPNNAPDIAQEVFINIYKAHVSFELSYIYRSAKNAAIGAIRKRKRERRVLYAHWQNIRLGKDGKPRQFDPPDRRPLQDAELLRRIQEEAMRRAIELLPEKFRTPLMLFADGKTYKQIMEVTEAHEGTVKSRICRGKSILRRKLRVYL